MSRGVDSCRYERNPSQARPLLEPGRVEVFSSRGEYFRDGRRKLRRHGAVVTMVTIGVLAACGGTTQRPAAEGGAGRSGSSGLTKAGSSNNGGRVGTGSAGKAGATFWFAQIPSTAPSTFGASRCSGRLRR